MMGDMNKFGRYEQASDNHRWATKKRGEGKKQEASEKARLPTDQPRKNQLTHLTHDTPILHTTGSYV
jgi:hypothetical protein